MKNVPNIILSVLLCIMAIVFLSGCEESAKSTGDKIPKGPFFYPAPPDLPVIQFLKSFSGPDVSKNKRSGLDAFILGEEDEQKTAIKKPFGFALYDNKFYICDTDAASVMILDLITGQFKAMNRDSRMSRPGNIFIDNGNKYIADREAGAVFVYGKKDEILAIWGRQEGLKPIDISVQGDFLYVLDAASSQVVVLDKTNGKVVKRLGTRGEEEGQLQYTTALAVDDDGSVYVSDMINAHITKLDSEGTYKKTYGYRSLNINGLSRPKGIDVDKDGRIWVVDSATNACKIFNQESDLLLYFGQVGAWPGDMYLPSTIRIDYDHIDVFQEYAEPDAQLECLIIISNQYGPNKISVYGLGKFPAQEARILKMREEAMIKQKDLTEGVISTDETEESDSE